MNNVLSFGAISDKSVNSTEAFQRAIDDCHANGGGVVYVPYGEYTLGTLHLRSNIHFVFESGARIFGSLNPDDFDKREQIDYPLYQDPSHSYFDRSLFVAKSCENITFSGYGTVDMQEVWEKEFTPNVSESSGKRAAKIFAIRECKNVIISDLTLLNSTDLAVYLAGCEHVKVLNLTIDVNIDGISPDGCRDVLISGCSVRSGDDSIVLKSSYTLNKLIHCENIVITNCTVSSRCNAIKIGTETNGDFKNIAISNCAIYDTYCGGVCIQSTDGGNIDGIAVSNITMNNVGYPFFFILSFRGRGPEGTTIGSIKNITVSNVTASGPYKEWICRKVTWMWEDKDCITKPTPMPSSITGQPDHPIENISLSNVFITAKGGGREEDKQVVPPEITGMYPDNRRFGKVFPSYGIFFRHVKNLKLSNVNIETIEPDGRDAFSFDDVDGVKID